MGTHGLSAILITSPSGHILIDGGLMESAPLIEASIRTLGFRLDDVRVILNSHVHYDHAGGIAALQRMSGAEVFASASSVSVLQQGTVGRDDPQFGEATPIAAVARVREIPANDTVRAGALVVRALRTAGHTPGGTSWSWTSCEGSRCLQLVYADSQSPISADDFFFSRSTAYPRAIADFEAGFATLEQLRCDVLVTPHPDASGLWARIAKRDAGDAGALRDTTACVKYRGTDAISAKSYAYGLCKGETMHVRRMYGEVATPTRPAVTFVPDAPALLVTNTPTPLTAA